MFRDSQVSVGISIDTVVVGRDRTFSVSSSSVLFIFYSYFDRAIALGAEQLLAAENNDRKIAVEVKSFI